MSFLHRVITPLGIAAVLCGLPSAVVLAQYKFPHSAGGGSRFLKPRSTESKAGGLPRCDRRLH